MPIKTIQRERGSDTEQDRLKAIELVTPKCCPKCGSTELKMHITEWFAHSLDPSDLYNTGVLTEHQCDNCAISFWM